LPKPIETENGSGMHVHQSLFRKGRNCFYSEKDKYNLSKKAYGFIAGQLKYISQMCAVLSPLVNSYKRLVPGFEAPVFISWARQNRSALIRIPEEKRTEWRKKARIELRSPDPSCNLHLAFAVMLKAGLEGIKQKLTPPEPIEEDVYKFDDKKLEKKRIDTLPASLEAALECMRNSELVKQTLGEDAFRKYMRAKMAEWRRLRKYVTPLELDMYLNY
jgi:glutamine synthetase